MYGLDRAPRSVPELQTMLRQQGKNVPLAMLELLFAEDEGSPASKRPKK